VKDWGPFSRIADYDLLETLGSGGFADTFKAQKDGSLFAVKVFRELPMGTDAVRFEREIETLQLEHRTSSATSTAASTGTVACAGPTS
jgi:serine/threonine protein kinase